jgi:hypothetical protein
LRKQTAMIVAALLMSVAWLDAQPVTTGTIAGRVRDENGGALPGATVTASSDQGTKSVATDAGGRFLAPYLTPGLYTVRAELPGFRPVEKRGIDVRAGQRVEIELTLSPGTFSEAIEVGGASPLIDYSSAAGGATIESKLLAQVPVDRRLGASFELAPGVSSGGGSGSDNPSISGASGLENQYLIDGVSINDPRYGGLGVYNNSFATLGSGVSFDFVQEVQVRTSGADAEFAQSTGGVVSVVTRSGGNEWRGTVFSYLTPTGLEGERKRVSLDAGAANVTGDRRIEAGFTLGGPLVRDRTFVFAAANPQWETVRYVAPADFPLSAVGEIERERRIDSYAAKLTILARSDQRLDASFFGDPSHGPNGPQSSDAMLYRDTSAFSSLDYGAHNQTVLYQGVLTPSWLLEASVGRASTYLREHPSVDEWEVIDDTTRPRKYSGGKGGYNPSDSSLTMQYHLKSTTLVGKHEIRYGASWVDGLFDNTHGRTGPTFTLADGRQTRTGGRVNILADPVYGKIYRASRAGLEKTQDGRHQELGLFVQDRIAASSRLTASLGLRYEVQRLIGRLQSFTFRDDWAPRLALTYDPTGSGRMKLSASAGIFYASIPSDIAVLEFSGSSRVLRADYYDAALTQPIPDGVMAGGSTTHLLLQTTDATTVDPDAGVTYIREGTVGFEYEARPNLTVGARFVYRDMPRVLEDLGNAAMVLFLDPSSGVTDFQYHIGNPRDGYPPTVDGIGSFEAPIHRYRTLELTVDKRFSDNWTLLGSYRWSRLWGTYEGFYTNDMGQSRPGDSALYDFPSNDPTYTQIGVPLYGFRGDIRYLGRLGAGPLPNDRPHQLKLYGAYVFDFGTTVGLGLSAVSGRPLTPTAADAVYNRQGFIPEAPRGSGIETEDGFKRRTPTVVSLDLHVDHAFRLPVGRLTVIADVFNVLDRQTPLMYDQNTQLDFGTDNPDLGRVVAYQEPRRVRLGVRFEL